MKTKTYIRFASLLQTGIYNSYPSICRALGVCPDDLDELLLSETGCAGEELFGTFFYPD